MQFVTPVAVVVAVCVFALLAATPTHGLDIGIRNERVPVPDQVVETITHIVASLSDAADFARSVGPQFLDSDNLNAFMITTEAERLTRGLCGAVLAGRLSNQTDRLNFGRFRLDVLRDQYEPTISARDANQYLYYSQIPVRPPGAAVQLDYTATRPCFTFDGWTTVSLASLDLQLPASVERQCQSWGGPTTGLVVSNAEAVSLSDMTFTGLCGNDAGAVYLTDVQSLYMSNVRFEGVVSASFGGAVSMFGGTHLSVTDSTFIRVIVNAPLTSSVPAGLIYIEPKDTMAVYAFRNTYLCSGVPAVLGGSELAFLLPLFSHTVEATEQFTWWMPDDLLYDFTSYDLQSGDYLPQGCSLLLSLSCPVGFEATPVTRTSWDLLLSPQGDCIGPNSACTDLLTGAEADPRRCVPCAAGHFRSGFGASCTDPCPSGQQSTAARDGCQPCPVGTIPRGDVCQRCQVGRTSSADGTSCVSCSSSQYSTADRTCAVCPSGSRPSAGGSSCVCGPGIEWDASTGTCKQCSTGMYSDGYGLCTACPAESEPNSISTRCVCTLPKVFNSDGQCFCPPVYNTDQDGNCLCSLPNQEADDKCSCPAGQRIDVTTSVCVEV